MRFALEKTEEKMRVGIDMSLSSPAVACEKNGHIDILCFQQRKRDKPLQTREGHVYVEAVCYNKELAYMEKIEFITETIVEFIARRAEPELSIFIEGYAFAAVSSSVSVLCEVGGVLRYKLFKRGWKYYEIPASSIKKAFTGCGRATKPQMYEKFATCGLPPLQTWLRVEPHQHPLEDVVDAYAIATCAEPKMSCKHSRKPKRKRSDNSAFAS